MTKNNVQNRINNTDYSLPTHLTKANSSNDTAEISKKQQAFKLQWSITLFGTAIGAGVLFLPINAGIGGIWPLIFMTLIIGPMTFLSHRGLSRFVMSSSNPNGNIVDAVNEHFNSKISFAVTVCYFMAIFPILIIYGIGITNTVSSMITHQLHTSPPSRGFLSMLLIFGMIAIVYSGQKLILKVTNILVYPLIIILFFLSIYLIPQWTMVQFEVPFSTISFLKTFFLNIPVLVFAFNHSPAISTFSQSYRREFGASAEMHASGTLKNTAQLLVGFTMFFVFSCVLTLTPDQLLEAKRQNITVLSLFAQNENAYYFGWLAQIVAIIAIASSFFGHFMGTHEGLKGLLTRYFRKVNGEHINFGLISKLSTVFITLVVWLITYLNVSIMSLIEAMVAPIIAVILFIMPVITIKKVKSMHKYASKWDLFTLVMGIITITGFILSKLL